MKHTIKWLEKKIGKHDTNLLIYGIGLLGTITGVFFIQFESLFSVIAYPSIFLTTWAFERVNKLTKHKGANE